MSIRITSDDTSIYIVYCNNRMAPMVKAIQKICDTISNHIQPGKGNYGVYRNDFDVEKRNERPKRIRLDS